MTRNQLNTTHDATAGKTRDERAPMATVSPVECSLVVDTVVRRAKEAVGWSPEQLASGAVHDALPGAGQREGSRLDVGPACRAQPATDPRGDWFSPSATTRGAQASTNPQVDWLRAAVAAHQVQVAADPSQKCADTARRAQEAGSCRVRPLAAAAAGQMEVVANVPQEWLSATATSHLVRLAAYSSPTSLLPYPVDWQLSEFNSSKDLYTSLQNQALKASFSLWILRSCNKKGSIVICCDRGGHHVTTSTKRTTKTKKTGCVLRLFGKRGSDNKWRFVRTEGGHNHDLSKDIRVHASARRLTGEQKKQRSRLEAAGVKPRAHLAFLRQEYEDFRGVQQDIYNEKQQCKRLFLNGRSTVQALFDEIQANGYHFQYRCNETSNISHLLFAHPKSVALLRQFHAVLQFDCTYKTNKFGHPLLVCTGLTPTYKSFVTCLILLKREETANYEWALQAIQCLLQNESGPTVLVSDNEAALLSASVTVFPHVSRILCRWHVNKNVVRKRKKYFTDGGRWNHLVGAWKKLYNQVTEEDFSVCWIELKTDFSGKPAVVNYLESTWLKYKEKLVDTWVGRLLHFGSSTTSRAESSNAFFKKFLPSSVGDLLTVFQESNLAIEHQIHELQKAHADDVFKRHFFLVDVVYADVANKSQTTRSVK